VALAYERHGTGPPLVLLHGAGHRRQAWHPILDLVTPHRTVIAVDLPGHGESPPLPADGQRPAVQVIAEEVFALFGQLGLDRPHVAGNSLGGALALIAGARGRAASVTGLSPAGFWASWWHFGYTKAMFMSAQLAGPVARPAVPALARSTPGRWLIDGAFVARPSRMTAGQAAGDALAFLAARDAVRAVLAERVSFTEAIPADVPVTIAWGAKDRVLPLSQARVARQHLPQARFVRLAGCGHVPMTDDPSLVARILLDGSKRAAARG
jgi:pimeloyl-ACP methyl ester carboxylesterase